MILLGGKQQPYSEVCLYWPETRELSATNTSEEGGSERTESAEILCSPCLVCHAMMVELLGPCLQLINLLFSDCHLHLGFLYNSKIA